MKKATKHFSKPFLMIIGFFGLITILLFPLQRKLNVSIKNNSVEEERAKGFSIEYIDVTPDQGRKIDFVLKKCGLENTTSLQPDKSLDSRYKGKTAYVLTIGDINNIFVFLDKNKNVFAITYKNNKLYANNQVKSTLDDYIPTSDEKVDWMYYCQDQVKSILVSPSTASFPNIFLWNFVKVKNNLTVSSYVDSENLFGAEIRSEFQFEINIEKNQVTSFILDGEKLI